VRNASLHSVLVLPVETRARLDHAVLPRRRQPLALARRVQPDRVDAILTQLEADGVARRSPPQRGAARPRTSPAEDPAIVGLLELVAVLGIGEEVGEVRPQVEAVVDRVRGRREFATPQRSARIEREAVAGRFATVGSVERAVAVEASTVDRAARDLVGRIPLARVAHRGRGDLRLAHLPGVAQHAVELAVVLRHLPRPVVVHQLETIEHRAGAERHRPGEQPPLVVKRAERRLGHALRQRGDVGDRRATRRREVADRGKVGPLEVVDARDELGDQEVQVHVALAMRMRGQVDRHAGEPGREVGAVVEVEAAQEVLVRLARAAVLRDDHARHVLEHLPGTQQWPIPDQLAGDRALARGIGRPDRILVVAGDLEGVDALDALCMGHAREHRGDGSGQDAFRRHEFSPGPRRSPITYCRVSIRQRALPWREEAPVVPQACRR